MACGEVLKTLLERGLVAITGRAEELGRPMLYGTTKKFLDTFGLASIKDLPRTGEPAPSAIESKSTEAEPEPGQQPDADRIGAG